MPDSLDEAQAAEEVAARLAEPRPMRRGSLSVRFVKCNKPGCACRHKLEARHGPYASIVRTVGGKTTSVRIPAEKVEVARRQIQEGQHFRKEVEALWRACERWADEELAAPTDASPETAEKGGSRRRSTRRS
jgi:hypothetical protein